ncbi:hypothetical protein TNCT_146781 [Trichonephila clavata]|uniref:Uncharacterized protein n=1 Tax=Trichonephila clavata TaxID=2740835 RepID=A0A8X6KRL6_TRICU|nr:hypothetical protein TNCT_146781 [Trichonephila clavata]
MNTNITLQLATHQEKQDNTENWSTRPTLLHKSGPDFHKNYRIPLISISTSPGNLFFSRVERWKVRIRAQPRVTVTKQRLRGETLLYLLEFSENLPVNIAYQVCKDWN